MGLCQSNIDASVLTKEVPKDAGEHNVEVHQTSSSTRRRNSSSFSYAGTIRRNTSDNSSYHPETRPPLSDESKKSSYQNHFHLLSDEIIIEILSYISQAPYETSDDLIIPNHPEQQQQQQHYPDYYLSHNTLTHTFPYLCRQFYTLSKTNSLWMSSLIRLIRRNPSLWKYAFSKMIHVGKTIPSWSDYYNPTMDRDDYRLGVQVRNMEDFKGDKKEEMVLLDELISNVYESVQEQIEMRYHCNYDANDDHNHKEQFIPQTKGVKAFYIHLIRTYMQIPMPMFYMPMSSLRRNTSMTLAFFEPRYRYMLSEIMKGRPIQDFHGRPIRNVTISSSSSKRKEKNAKIEKRPQFLFVNKYTTTTSTNDSKTIQAKYGFLVEVKRCQMLEFGRSEVIIDIVKNVEIFQVKRRKDVESHGLYDAYIKKFH